MRGSLAAGQPLYGVSDIDMVVVLEGDGRERVRARMRRAERLPRPLRSLVEWAAVYERRRLEALAGRTIFTVGDAVYEPVADPDEVRLLERPETAGWRRVRGRELSVPESAAPPEHVAAWLELQYWWRTACEGCLEPSRLGSASLCVKLAAEPAALWLRLARGVRPGGRVDALEQAARELPEEADALERMLRLQRDLPRMPEAPFQEALALLLRMSVRVAEELSTRASAFTEVRLVRDEPALIRSGFEPTEPLPWPEPELRVLADFRALAGRLLPDEVLAPMDADPTDPSQLALLTRAFSEIGTYPEIAHGPLSIRPAASGKARLRGVQFTLTDPVSFARDDVARFPELPGWSAADLARRAVDEHRAWLAAGPHVRSPIAFGKLVTAARAALFADSVAAGEPELAVEAAGALAHIHPQAREDYLGYARKGDPPERDVIDDLDRTVRALPAYL